MGGDTRREKGMRKELAHALKIRDHDRNVAIAIALLFDKAEYVSGRGCRFFLRRAERRDRDRLYLSLVHGSVIAQRMSIQEGKFGCF